MPYVGLDEAAIAGFYSQLTGVLAGFAFTGLVLVMTYRLGEEGRRDRSGVGAKIEKAIALLFGGFLGLVFSSLAYAVIAGTSSDSLKAAQEHVIAGSGFGTASLIVLVALLHLIDATITTRSESVFLTMAIFGPTVVLTFALGGAIDVSHKTHDGKLFSMILTTGCLQGLMLIVGIVAWLGGGRATPLRSYIVDRSEDLRGSRRLGTSAVATASLAGISTEAMSNTGEATSQLTYWIYPFLLLLLLICGLATMYCFGEYFRLRPTAVPHLPNADQQSDQEMSHHGIVVVDEYWTPRTK
jgi:hypothetical protein